MDLPKIIHFIAAALIAVALPAQDMLHGTVKVREADRSLQLLPDARVGWVGGAAVMSDSIGRFHLPLPTAWPAVLVTSSFATSPDTLRLEGRGQHPHGARQHVAERPGRQR